MEELRQGWSEIEQIPFPAGYRGKAVGGVDLTMLESEAGGFVLTFLETGGKFGLRLYGELKRCAEQLTTVVAELDGEAKEYFSKIKTLIDTVLEESPAPLEWGSTENTEE